MPATYSDRLNGLTTSVAVKAPVRVATTANITLSGLQTIDGISLAADDRVLVKDQTDSVDNGIWVVGTSAWQRSADFNGSRDAVKGTIVPVNEGESIGGNGKFFKVQTENDPDLGYIVIGTDEVTFGVFTSAAEDKSFGGILARMAAGDAIKLAFYGDSTTDGNETTGWTANPVDGSGNAVGAIDHEATAPNAYPAVLKAILQDAYNNATIECWNAGYSGRKVSDGWALANYEAAIIDNPQYGVPDVVFIAFGLNDAKGAGVSNYADHLIQLRLLVERILEDGTIPILLTCDPVITRDDDASGRDAVEVSRQIDAVKFNVAAEYGIPLIDIAADMKDWFRFNRDGYRWFTEQTDAVHFEDNGHAMKACVLFKHLFRDIVIVGREEKRLPTFDSAVEWEGPTGTASDIFDAANTDMGGNPNYTNNAPADTALMTAWVFNTSSDTELIYRGIGHEEYGDEDATTNAPSIDVTEKIADTTISKSPAACGFPETGNYLKSDIPYRFGHLNYGLSKIEYKSGNDDDNYYGYFEFWQTPKGQVWKNALKNTGRYQYTFPNGAADAVNLIPEFRDGSNIYGLFDGEEVDIFIDVSLTETGLGFIFSHCNGWGGGADYGQKAFSMIYRHTDDRLRLYQGRRLANGTVDYDTFLAASTNPLVWSDPRKRLRINIVRNSSNNQVVTVYDGWHGGTALVTYTAPSDGTRIMNFGGAVGGFFINDATASDGVGILHAAMIWQRPEGTDTTAAFAYTDKEIFSGKANDWYGVNTHYVAMTETGTPVEVVRYAVYDPGINQNPGDGVSWGVYADLTGPSPAVGTKIGGQSYEKVTTSDSSLAFNYFVAIHDGTNLKNRIKGDVNGLSTLMGESTAYKITHGVADVNTGNVGNVGGGTDDLITYTLPASAMSAAKKGVRITAWGTTANNANAKTVTMNFGSQVLVTTALTTSQAGVWRIVAEVISTGTDTQDYVATLMQGGATTILDVEQGTATQDDGASIIIKCTGAATTTNDIVQSGMITEFID